MPLSRRTLIAASLAALPALAPEARAQADGQWRAITGDNGQPLPNTRLPASSSPRSGGCAA